MSERVVVLLLEDIQNSIESILGYTKNFTFEMYCDDQKTRHAVERNFEIIGEAVSRVSNTFKESNLNIEWRVLKDFRNFIIHEYFGINQQIVWDTIQLRLPKLLEDITQLINNLD